jgi:hypothetical protein
MPVSCICFAQVNLKISIQILRRIPTHPGAVQKRLERQVYYPDSLCSTTSGPARVGKTKILSTRVSMFTGIAGVGNSIFYFCFWRDSAFYKPLLRMRVQLYICLLNCDCFLYASCQQTAVHWLILSFKMLFNKTSGLTETMQNWSMQINFAMADVKQLVLYKHMLNIKELRVR